MSASDFRGAFLIPEAAMSLTAKQQRFVDEYLIDLNATQAAIRAGYSAKTADVIGYENLRKPQIMEIIEQAMQKREKRTEITQDRVLEELADIAFNDGGTQKTSDRLKALDLIGRNLGMFKEKIELSGNLGLAARLSAARDRIKPDGG